MSFFEIDEEQYKISRDRLQQIADIAELPWTRVREICLYPWPDKEVHQQWLDEAPAIEIAHWARFIHEQEDRGKG